MGLSQPGAPPNFPFWKLREIIPFSSKEDSCILQNAFHNGTILLVWLIGFSLKKKKNKSPLPRTPGPGNPHLPTSFQPPGVGGAYLPRGSGRAEWSVLGEPGDGRWRCHQTRPLTWCQISPMSTVERKEKLKMPKQATKDRACPFHSLASCHSHQCRVCAQHTPAGWFWGWGSALGYHYSGTLLPTLSRTPIPGADDRQTLKSSKWFQIFFTLTHDTFASQKKGVTTLQEVWDRSSLWPANLTENSRTSPSLSLGPQSRKTMISQHYHLSSHRKHQAHRLT